jgi:hypothetical protein
MTDCYTNHALFPPHKNTTKDNAFSPKQQKFKTQNSFGE